MVARVIVAARHVSKGHAFMLTSFVRRGTTARSTMSRTFASHTHSWHSSAAAFSTHTCEGMARDPAMAPRPPPRLSEFADAPPSSPPFFPFLSFFPFFPFLPLAASAC